MGKIKCILLAVTLLAAALACNMDPPKPEDRMLNFSRALGRGKIGPIMSSFTSGVRSRDDRPRIERALTELTGILGAYEGKLTHLSTNYEGSNQAQHTCHVLYRAMYANGEATFTATLRMERSGWFIDEIRVSAPGYSRWIPFK